MKPLTLVPDGQTKRQRLLDHLARTLRLTNTALSSEQVEFWLCELMHYDETLVAQALHKVVLTTRGQVFLVDVLRTMHELRPV